MDHGEDGFAAGDSSNSAGAAAATEEERNNSSSGAPAASAAETAATAATNGVPPSKDNATAAGETAEQEKNDREALKEKASEGLRLLLQHKPPSTPDTALLEEHKKKHPECIQLLEHMETLLAKRLYHEFTLASTAYLAPLVLLGSSNNAGGESRGAGGAAADGQGSAGPLAAAAALSFPPFPSGYPTFEPFERVNFFHRVTAPLRPKMDLSAFLRLLAAVCEDLEPVDALVFLDEHKLYSSDNSRDQQQQSYLRGSSSSSRPSRSGDSAASAGGGGASSGRRGGSTSRSSSGTSSSSAAVASSSSLAAAAAALEAELLYESCESYHLSRCDRLTESDEILEELKKKLAVTMGVSPIAQAAFHRAAATLAKAQDKHADFYQQAMMFLAYTPAASIPENERVGLAYEVAIAALVAPDIFNFGELLQQALVISSLKLPEHRWLYDLVEAFHCGSMAKYDDTCSRFAQQIQSTALAGHMPALRRKISIAALLRLAFTHSAAGAATAATAPEGGRGSNGCDDTSSSAADKAVGIDGGAAGERRSAAARSLSFQVVANTCNVGIDEVELLVMSAMSKQLLRGTIDQVNREVNISWVRPALLLDDSGMACLQERLLRWVATAQHLHQHLQGQTAELLGS